MTSGRSRTVSLKVLTALTAAVLLVHLALLQDMPLTVLPQQNQLPQAFSTRLVAAVPSSAAPAEAAPAPSPQAPRPRVKRAPAARTAQPKPAEPAELASASSEPGTPAAPPMADTQEASLAVPAAPQAAASEPAPPNEAPAPAEAPGPAARPRREPTPPARVYRVPASVRLKYEVKGNKFPYSLNAELLWQQSADSYNARLAFNAAFLPVIGQTSQGQVTAQGLAPVRFADRRRSEVAAHFVREQGKITFSANTPDAPLLAGAQDRLSVVLQLGAMIAGDPGAYPAATTITLQVVGPRDADIWLFTVGDEETLALPGGELRALKLQRNPREAFDQTVELWLAPSMGYLPVRMRIAESNGDFADQKWLSSEPLP